MDRSVLQTKIRVLIVDEDTVVRELLSRELGQAGYEVDTLSSGTGFTDDMVNLIRPDVLLVDPFIGDVPLPEVERMLGGLRAQIPLRLVLIDGGQKPLEIERIAIACRADGRISKRELLRAPADALAEHCLPEVEPVDLVEEELKDEEVREEDLPTAEIAHEQGTDIQLSHGPAPRREVPAPPTTPRTIARSASDILAMIEDEIGEVAPPEPKVKESHFEVAIHLFSRHNFYVGATGDLRTGGVFVATSATPKVGDRVSLKLQIPFLSILETQAPVQWVREGGRMGRVTSGVGLSLAHLPASQRAALEKFFFERAPLTYLNK
jgi:CheY-like chemotaxis protein/Tfp pilus assembly protein PilZ